jgi:hypothetical protein
MMMGVKETVQNRLTNQSAAWGVIAAIVTAALPLLSIDTPLGFDGLQKLTWVTAMVLIAMIFIRSDKQQEHTNAAAALTNPKILEQTCDRLERVFEGFAKVFAEAKVQLERPDTPEIELEV